MNVQDVSGRSKKSTIEMPQSGNLSGEFEEQERAWCGCSEVSEVLSDMTWSQIYVKSRRPL